MTFVIDSAHIKIIFVTVNAKTCFNKKLTNVYKCLFNKCISMPFAKSSQESDFRSLKHNYPEHRRKDLPNDTCRVIIFL